MTAIYRRVYGEIKIRVDQREHYHERGQRAAAEGVVLTAYAPAPDSPLERLLLPGSAIVGSPAIGPPAEAGGMVVIHFEGAKFQNMTLDERFLHAASRHVCRYPTVAMMHTPRGDLVEVGTYDVATDRLDVTDQAALDRWLATDARLAS